MHMMAYTQMYSTIAQAASGGTGTAGDEGGHEGGAYNGDEVQHYNIMHYILRHVYLLAISPSHVMGCVVHDDNQGFQPPLAKRSKVDHPPGPSPQVSHYIESP